MESMFNPATVDPRDQGLVSLADVEAGSSGENHLFLTSKRKAAPYMAFSSPRYGEEQQPPRHFLDACHLCKKPISQNTDIFMYRGDTPFCSEACRQEQIDLDEALETNRCLSIRVASSNSKKDPKKLGISRGRSQSFNPRAGTVVAG